MVDESIFSDEELMSFADGELSEPDNERILLAMASDSSLKARVESFRLSANLLRTSLSVEGNSTPDHIKHRIREIQKSPIRSVETEVEKPLYLKLRRLFDFSFLVPATAIFACGIILSPIIGFGNFGDEDALGLVATRGVSQSISNEGLIDFFDIQAIQRGVSIPNNGAIVENVPFIISFKSAFAGSATIYEVTEGVDGSALDSQIMQIGNFLTFRTMSVNDQESIQFRIAMEGPSLNASYSITFMIDD